MRAACGLAGVLVGCSTSGSAPDSAPAHSSTVLVDWALQSSQQQPEPCPPGYDTAEVFSGGAGGEGSAVDYPCAAGSGTITDASTAHDPWAAGVKIKNGATGAVFVVYTGGFIEGASSVHLVVTVDFGELVPQWTVSQGGVPSTCEAAGVTSVMVAVTQAGGRELVTTAACTDYAAMTPALWSGAATVVISAGAATGSAAAMVPTGAGSAAAPAIDLAF